MRQAVKALGALEVGSCPEPAVEAAQGWCSTRRGESRKVAGTSPSWREEQPSFGFCTQHVAPAQGGREAERRQDCLPAPPGVLIWGRFGPRWG